MDYLYLNAIVKEVYKDLPCGCPFPAEFGKNLYAAVSGLDCLSNPEVPAVLSLFTLRAKGQSSAVVLSKIQKHTNSASVGRFIQSIGWTWNGDLLFRNLSEVLDAGFFSEEEINDTALRGGSFALPKGRRGDYREIPLEFSPQVKQAILTTVLLRWLRFEAPLRIAVPKNVDYNSYVLSAMKQIYSLFPASMRAKAGFCSYLPSDKNVPEIISIGFVPEEMADSRTLCLDGSSAAACAKLNCGTNSTPLDAFIAKIANASESELQEFFEEIYADLEGSGSNEKMVLVSPRDYQTIGTALLLMNLEGSLSELVSQWNSKFFNHKEREKISASWQTRIRNKIRETIDPAEFCRLAERRLAAEAFDGLTAYQEYCVGNQELTDALWTTAVAQQIGRKKTYTEIYNHVEKRKDLAFVLDDAKLDRLFCQAVEEQLQTLRGKPAQTLREIKGLMTEVKKLQEFAGTRNVAEAEALRQGVQVFLDELKNRGNGMILEKLNATFLQMKGQPHEDETRKIQEQMDALAEFRKSVAEKAAIPGVDQLLTEIDGFAAELNDRKNQLIHEGLAHRYSKLTSKPARTVEEIEKVIEAARVLLADVAAAAPIPANAKLQAALQSFVAEKETEIHSSNVKFQEIAKIFDNWQLTYFAVLEALDKADKSQLEDHHRQTISDRLAICRPDSLEDYEKAFVNHYGQPLVLASVAALTDYVAGIIARDICLLEKISLSCSQADTAVENAERIIKALAIAEKISGAHKVAVTFDGTNVSDPLWFKNLLLLNHNAATVGDKSRLERVVRSLVEKNAFSGNEMVPALAMLIRCKLDPSALLPYILRGDFRDATEQQYRQAYELLLQSSEVSTRETLEAMQEDVESRKDHADSVAYKAFRNFCRDHKPRETAKPNKLMIPIICGLGVVIVALAVALVLLVVNKNKAAKIEPTTVPTTVATVPVETEPPVVYPEEFVFFHQEADGIRLLYSNDYAGEFSSHSLRVAELLDAADEELADMILNSYSNFHGTKMTIDDRGTEVSWDEYFFWLCWFYADRDTMMFRDVMQTAEPVEDVLSVLRVIHHDLPAAEAVAEDPVPVATEAEETVPETAVSEIAEESTAAAETQETAAVENTEDTVAAETTAETVPETTEAVTEPVETEPVETEPVETEPVETEPAPVTIGDIKAVITEAAAENYEMSQDYAERLLLIRKLFGEDFQTDFTSHAVLVEGMNLTADQASAAYLYFMDHFNQLPGKTVIRFEDTGIEVTWDEYVFWECWALAQNGTAVIQENSFNGDLREDVVEILTVIHQLVEAEVQEETVSDAADSENPDGSVLQNMVQSAKTSFENAQKNYRSVFVQLQNGM